MQLGLATFIVAGLLFPDFHIEGQSTRWNTRPNTTARRFFKFTLNVFSGRSDPEWDIDEADPLFDQVSLALETANTTDLSNSLGYRGLTVEFTDRNGQTKWKTIGRRSNVQLEEMLVETCDHIDPRVDQYVRSAIHNRIMTTEPHRPTSFLDDLMSLLHTGFQSSAGKTNALETEQFEEMMEQQMSAMRFKRHVPVSPSPRNTVNPSICKQPAYDPENWNYLPVRRRNNCYNYATNTRTNTFAQPGRGSGQRFRNYSSHELISAVARDGLIPLNGRAPSPFQTRGACLIAVVIWPGIDYHFYRLDNNSLWSHKRGQTRAKNVDESSALIYDPRSADRGPYSEFASFLGVFDEVNIK